VALKRPWWRRASCPRRSRSAATTRYRKRRVSLPGDGGDARRKRRDRRLADPQRRCSIPRAARRGFRSTTAAASGSATHSTPAR
jgi:hypothetical protein